MAVKPLDKFHIKRINDNNYTVVIKDLLGRIQYVATGFKGQKEAVAYVRLYDPYFKLNMDLIREENNPVVMWLARYKETLVCAECGSTVNITFHHVDPTMKQFNISEASKLGKSIKEVKDELKKCVPLCISCHRKHHIIKEEKDDEEVYVATKDPVQR